MGFSETKIVKIHIQRILLGQIMSSNGASFSFNGIVNSYWVCENPHWIRHTIFRIKKKLLLRAGIINNTIINTPY